MVYYATQERVADSYRLDPGVYRRVRGVLLAVAAAAWLASIGGFLLDRAQFFHSYLVGFTFSTTIALGALFFVMVQYLTGSAWSVPVRRLMETFAVSLPAGLLLFLPIAFGMHELYEWSHDKNVMEEMVKLGKASYLSPQWFIARALLYLGIWSLWAYKLYQHSTEQDRTKSIERMHSCSRWSAPGLLFIFLSVTLAAFDWIMSLNPRWYSTIFGIYTYAGGAWAFFATLTLTCLGLRRAGMLRNTITVEHFHDLGKWLFALTVFWAYIAFSQYMLIWYANIPEETIFYRWRLEGTWAYASAALLFGHFVIPFLILLPRASKRNLTLLGWVSAFILAVHFLDHYWMIMPNFQHQGDAAHPASVRFHWLDLSCLVAVFGVYALVVWNQLRKQALLPVGDPRLRQGLEFVNS